MRLDAPTRIMRHSLTSSLLPSAPLGIPVAGRGLQHLVASSGSSALTLPAKVLSLSGGATTEKVVNLTRIGMRLSAMSSYALIASLMLGSGLYLFAITPLKVESTAEGKTASKLEQRVIAAFTVAVAINIATSLHTSLVFNVMNLYANTALGQGLDKEFLLFWNAPHCQTLRNTAFYSFLAAIQSFKLSFVMSVFLKSDGKHRWVATGVAGSIMLVSSLVNSKLIGIATDLIFHN